MKLNLLIEPVKKVRVATEFDFLVNATSIPSHYPISKKVLEAGKHGKAFAIAA